LFVVVPLGLDDLLQFEVVVLAVLDLLVLRHLHTLTL
jgi:hypothetical protein